MKESKEFILVTLLTGTLIGFIFAIVWAYLGLWNLAATCFIAAIFCEWLRRVRKEYNEEE